MPLLLSLLAMLVASPTLTLAANVTLDWTVGYVSNVNPDGLYPRRAIGVNGAFPPPIINVNQSDTLTIRFTNGFDDGRGTALHSHGMYFNNTNYWDGAALVTQCPIPAQQTIEYQPLNSPQSPADARPQWGTFWTHGHYQGQYQDGLRTPSIIHAESEVYQYDDDFTIILADWYHREHQDLLVNEFLNRKNPTGAEPVPDSGLLYLAHTPASGPATYLTGFNENATLPFEAGKTYRLRIVNMAALSMFNFWIEGHQMRIIEADGTDTQPLEVDSVSIAVAQRYSVLVTARNDTTQNWPMHANLNPDMYDQVPPTLQLNLTGTVSYGTGNPMGSDRPTIEYEYFDDTALVPVVVEPQMTVDVVHKVAFDFTTYADGKSYAEFNGTTFQTPLTPTLMTAMTMANQSDLAQVYGPNSNAIVAPHQKVIDIEIINLDTGHHPFHLHGHNFQLVHKSQDLTSDDPTLNPPRLENQTNPMRRDTVSIPGGGSATFRLLSDNPGAWFLHCHITWHLDAGLALVLIEAPEQMQQNIQVPSSIGQQCQAMGLPSSGNAGGLQSLTNFGALPAAPHHLISGWTATAIGTFVACLLTALIGIATICWYGFANGVHHDEAEEEQ